MADQFFARVLVPVASGEDARTTAAALGPYLDATTEVVVVNVVEKAGGAPDKASVEQREMDAASAFDDFEEALPADVSVQREILYGTDVAATVLDGADEFDASAVAFTPRGGSAWVKLLTGDVTTTLVEEADLPVVVLPDVPEEP